MREWGHELVYGGIEELLSSRRRWMGGRHGKGRSIELHCGATAVGEGQLWSHLSAHETRWVQRTCRVSCCRGLSFLPVPRVSVVELLPEGRIERLCARGPFKRGNL